MSNPTHAIHIIDNWDGEGDKYWMFAHKNNGEWVSSETNKPVLVHKGDQVLKAVSLEG